MVKLEKRGIIVFALFLLFTLNIQKVKASVLTGPTCFVMGEIIDIGIEKRKLDSGRIYESHYIDLKILVVRGKNKACLVSKDQIFRITDNNSGVFKIKDRIIAGIERVTSMGPYGSVVFLQWSNITYENGTPIFGKNNIKIDFLQSSDKPIN